MREEAFCKVQYRAANGDGDAKMEVVRRYVWADEAKPVPPKQARRAVQYLRELVRKNNGEAMLCLGAMHYTGRVVEQNYAKAVRWYRAAADQGLHWANNNLGYCHYYGRSIPVDYEKALSYFMKAACAGNENSMYKIGDMYYNGYFVSQDYMVAYAWYQKAMDTSEWDGECYPEISFRLGNCYFYGRGVERDLLEALYHYQQAEYFFYKKIQQGDPFAARTLKTVNERLDELRDELRGSLNERGSAPPAR